MLAITSRSASSPLASKDSFVFWPSRARKLAAFRNGASLSVPACDKHRTSFLLQLCNGNKPSRSRPGRRTQCLVSAAVRPAPPKLPRVLFLNLTALLFLPVLAIRRFVECLWWCLQPQSYKNAMKIRAWYPFSATAFCLLIACTTAEPDSHINEYRTFTIAPLSTKGSSSDPASAIRMNDEVRDAILESLTAKGYMVKALSDADFVVNIETSFSQDPIFESSERRSLMIGFYDKFSHDLIWSNRRGRSSSRTMQPEQFRQSILSMLEPLPHAPYQK
jgi:hypothetical protein